MLYETQCQGVTTQDERLQAASGRFSFTSTSNRGYSTKQFSDTFKTAFSLRWVSPLSSDGYREYSDSAFLDALGLPQHSKELSRFWPSGGPHWDTLACVEKTGGCSAG